jgi:hypothetical protein
MWVGFGLVSFGVFCFGGQHGNKEVIRTSKSLIYQERVS